MIRHYLAFDLGAESGRLMLGTISDGHLSLQEIHRFANTPISKDGSLYWNIESLFEEARKGLKLAGELQLPISSISTDTWGVDYLLFDDAASVISPTFHYRDPRTEKGVKKAFEKIDWNSLFAETGIQFMPLNTVFQLMAETPERLERASVLLGIGDGLNYLLSGNAVAERSLASTMQLYNPRTHEWSQELLSRLGLPERLFPKIVNPGTVIGPLKPEWARSAGLNGTQVIATCSHDTGAAVVGVPARSESWAYLSSGTWSLLGVEIPQPIINDAGREANFTNEVGFGDTVRLLKNIIGLWLVQECRRQWAREGMDYDYDTLTRLASEAPPFVSLINPADPRFLSPGDMPAKIAAFCAEKGETAPTRPGATIRCILESLALLYARTLKQVEAVIGKRIERLHIVGGGSKNELLNQLTANAARIPVIAGPVEATAAGNVVVQAIALGHLKTLDEARDVIHRSFELKEFLPQNDPTWDTVAKRFDAFAVHSS